MNKRLIEVATEIARVSEDRMMHKGTDIAGLVYLSTFHAAIQALSNLPEFEPECVVSGAVNFDEVGEALLRDLEPIYAASDAIKEDDDKPANPDKWREWQEGEIPRNVNHLVRVSDSDANFTYGHVYKVSELKMNDGYVAIKTSFGLDVLFSDKLAKIKFRPSV